MDVSCSAELMCHAAFRTIQLQQYMTYIVGVKILL